MYVLIAGIVYRVTGKLQFVAFIQLSKLPCSAWVV